MNSEVSHGIGWPCGAGLRFRQQCAERFVCNVFGYRCRASRVVVRDDDEAPAIEAPGTVGAGVAVAREGVLADTGESKIYTDKRIFEVSYENTNLDKESLVELRKKYENYYSVTDEKFNEDEFEKNVSAEYRLKTKGIEVGHIFYFGDKYSKPLNASVDLVGGKKDFVKMGSYGIGVSRLVGAIIEAKYDDKAEVMKWPFSVAPYELAIIPMINKNETKALDKANNIFKFFDKHNIDTIIDDTDENLSSKIKKFNLIGVPYQIIIGKKSEGDLLEFKELGKEPKNLTIDQITKILTKLKIKN